ncbi:expressed unknown protein [Seminavis robusta]|uniref:Alpha-(1,6)-fucosyltransferase N- and catalytic domain-containing protein n=1 Tax=Seminavis robusta TaxID=568900 RepID=A0A9N8DLB0_9STRA|nr:expressed unknown protein [Seminavis robusta]|eukprot:Sro187_g080830.1 n/a (1220) ;mRNA; r:11528-15435
MALSTRKLRHKTAKKKDDPTSASRPTTPRHLYSRVTLVSCAVVLVVVSLASQTGVLSNFTIEFVEISQLVNATSGSTATSSTTPPRTVLSPLSKFDSHFCVDWETDTDAWWSAHPDWFVDVTAENVTHTCFQQIQDDPQKTKFMRLMHHEQFVVNLASNKCSSQGIYAAAPHNHPQFSIDTWTAQLEPLVQGLAWGRELQRPFQSTADCSQHPSFFLECFLLPLSSCPTNHTPNFNQIQQDHPDDIPDPITPLQQRWYWEYLVRPKSNIRRQVGRTHSNTKQSPQSKQQDCAIFLLHPTTTMQQIKELLDDKYKRDLDQKDRVLLLAHTNQQIKDMQAQRHPQWTPVPLPTTQEQQQDPQQFMIRLLTLLQQIQLHSCDVLLHFDDSTQDAFSEYIYWEMVAAQNRPPSMAGATAYSVQSILRKYRKQRPTKEPIQYYPKRITIPAPVVAGVQPQSTTATELPSNMVEWIDAQNEYRVKQDYYSVDRNSFCVPWHVNADLWWTHHRDWQHGRENDTHYCFQKVQDAEKARFFQNLYHLQFPTTSTCHDDDVSMVKMWNSGWGADMTNLANALQQAHQTNRPVQVDTSTHWHYAVTKKLVNKSHALLEACPQKNMYCYLLNMSSCTPSSTTTHDAPDFSSNNDRHRWYLEWLVRPQTWLRKRVYDYLHSQSSGAPRMQTPCSVLHVRRNDVVLHDKQARKFHPIDDYINNTRVHDNILLLTDDHYAIGEARTKYPQYRWMYFERPRFRGVGGWEHHLPSDDPVLEVVVLFATFQLVRQCDQIVLSTGKFGEYLYQEMKRGDRQVERVNIDAGMSQTEVLNEGNSKTHVVSKDYVNEKHAGLTAGGGANNIKLEPPSKKVHDFVDPFCVPWDTTEMNVDEWWTHHPMWEMGPNNATHQCFQPMADEREAKLLEELYRVQFVTGDCTNMTTKRTWSSGWGADFENIVDGFFHALKTGTPVQMGTDRWHYADNSVKKKQTDESLRIACPQRNMFCYFLPYSRCPPQDKGWEGDFLTPPAKGLEEYNWLVHYATRQQSWLRKRVSDFVQQQQANLVAPCSVLHVRRADVVFHGSHSRKYHGIEEYLEHAQQKNMTVHKNILILTDDFNAIPEAKAKFPDYNWIYIDRPRIKSANAKWEQHLASDDPVYEMVVLQSIFRLVKQCSQLIRSSSNFGEHVKWEMQSKGQAIEDLNIDHGKEAHVVWNENNTASVNVSRGYRRRRTRG